MTNSVAPPEPLRRGSSSILGGAVMIAAVTVAARIAGFGRIVVFARTVGPTCLGDVYTTANTIPNIVFDIVAGGALSSLVIPVLAGRFATREDDAARQTMGALLGWAVVLLVPVAVLGGLLAHPLMSLLVGGGQPGCDRSNEVALGARMLVVFAPQIVLYGVGVVLAGILQARRQFLGPAAAPLLSSLVVIATYLGFAVVGPRLGVSSHLTAGTWLLAAGTTLGVVALSLPLAWPALRGWRVRPGLRFPPGVARTVRRLALAGAVVLTAQDLTTAVVLRLANSDGIAGSVVVYNLAWTVFQLPWAVLAVPVATSAFPEFTAAWERGDRSAYADSLASTTRLVTALVTASIAVVVAVAEPAARVLVAGAPGRVAPDVVGRALVTLAPGLLGFGLLALWSRARYSRGDARLPAAATASGWLVAIVAAVVVAGRVPAPWVPAALSGAVALGVTVAGLALAVPVVRDLGDGGRPVVRTAVASLAAAMAGAVVGRLICAGFGAQGPAASVGTVVAGTLGCLLVVAVVLRMADAGIVEGALRRLRTVRLGRSPAPDVSASDRL